MSLVCNEASIITAVFDLIETLQRKNEWILQISNLENIFKIKLIKAK